MDALNESAGLVSTGPLKPVIIPTQERVQTRRVREWLGVAVIFAQVMLIAAIMRAVGLEPLGFRRIVYLAAVGFVVHHLLPLRFRLWFFGAFSLGCTVLILGGTIDSRIPDIALGLMRTVTIVGVGAGFVAICHLPFGFWTRVLLLAVGGVIVAGFRANFFGQGSLAIVWPVLASILMFRLMVYLYDLSTSSKRPTKGQTLAYFALFPNVGALLFPVVDFRTLCQKYYDEDALIIYQRGVRWMTRGVIHLLLYRLVDQLLALESSAVTNGADLIQFVISNLFLYLKVSGAFHFVVGLLLLFGFNLPETNHRYFLASSFTDYWRRVNIYWRNFIMKVFYYPTFFRFKRLGQVRALVIATLWSFFVTWALHLYQTWWIKGAVGWSWPDTLFWASLALLVLGNSLWELKRNRSRKLPTGKFSAREAGMLALRTAATFSIIAVLWSLWSSPTLSQWLHIWSLADRDTALGAASVLAVIMAAALLWETHAFSTRPAEAKKSRGPLAILRSETFQCVGTLLIIFGVSHPLLRTRLAETTRPQLVELSAWMEVLRAGSSETRGQARGYYENLTSHDEGAGQYFQAMNPGKKLRLTQPTREVPGVHFRELVPNTEFESHGWRFTTNRWGMRDRDYELTKPEGVTRLALLGSSQVMGFGLSDHELFGAIIEESLNTTGEAEARQVEVLNFAIGGLSPLGQVWFMEDRVPRFQPDLILFVAHPNDFEWSNRDLVRTLRKRLVLPPTLPEDLLTRAGVSSRTPEALASPRLRPHEAEILSALYLQVANQCRAINARPIYVFLPVPAELPLDPVRTAQQLKLAEDAGFVVVDLSTVFTGRNPLQMVLNDEGRHINAEGNALVAAALHDQLVNNPGIDLFGRAAPKAR